jgi:hypothetical protein
VSGRVLVFALDWEVWMDRLSPGSRYLQCIDILLPDIDLEVRAGVDQPIAVKETPPDNRPCLGFRLGEQRRGCGSRRRNLAASVGYSGRR